MEPITTDEIERVAAAIMRIDGDRDHMNRSDMTCEQTQEIARFLRRIAAEKRG
jgi:hypothetical protein